MRTFRDFWRIVEVLGSSLSLNKGTGLVVVNPTATGLGPERKHLGHLASNLRVIFERASIEKPSP